MFGDHFRSFCKSFSLLSSLSSYGVHQGAEYQELSESYIISPSDAYRSSDTVIKIKLSFKNSTLNVISQFIQSFKYFGPHEISEECKVEVFRGSKYLEMKYTLAFSFRS